MKKLLALTFLAATLATGALSVHALGTKTQAQTCGQTCRVPGISCPKAASVKSVALTLAFA